MAKSGDHWLINGYGPGYNAHVHVRDTDEVEFTDMLGNLSKVNILDKKTWGDIRVYIINIPDETDMIQFKLSI